jgi:TRAP-type C4-dicarboxylate transport system substrate-binding protein
MKIRKSLLAGVSGAIAIAFSTVAQADEIVARMSYHWAPKHPSAIHAKAFAEAVNTRLAGKFKIELYPAGQLFGIREVLGAIASGAVEMGGVVGVVSFPSINKNYSVAVFPGYFDSFAQQRKFFEEDPVGNRVWSNILEKSRSTVIAYNPVGPFAVYSTVDKLDTVDSLKGLKARVLTKPDRARWKGLGIGKMVSMPTREVYTSLQNGTIDTVSTVPSALKAYSWWEYLKSGQLPYIGFADAYLMANTPWFNGLPDEIKKVLTEEGAKTSKASTDGILSASDTMHKEFVARGGHLTVLEGAELAKLRKVEAEKVEPALAEQVDPDVFAALKKFSGR